jgi:protein-tyrosine phosphatase
MTPFRVLFVCIGNVCRSPLGELSLRPLLPEGFEVASAGVAALVGEPMTPEAAVHLEAEGLSAEGFRSRQLVPSMVQESDLVLTATRAIRSRVLEDTPTALRRTFTVLEFAALLDVVAPDPGAGPADLVALAAAERSRATLEDDDIPDPYRRGVEANARAAALMGGAVRRIAAGLAPGLTEDSDLSATLRP